ncbi:uncharacterized protein MELLADRAFT_78042 [Melampsora larici-populina 98AG31]|uniref:Uncharacterized protein n=1 Tax=Melampsora larici-populina (strain 98AG31 / pathotype 3-4-7) TaxID=747676 RepID=F4RPL4_MELLP|nr:uncharacterized protein MELLADRAFT_78042 [Melampsora larici-populina 98AG31]EGG05705.1 hypothetical protein MELLADRAFT_78042 [Melampsora larici-populina 98AG31]
MSVLNQASSKHHRPGIAIEAGSPELICKLQDLAKRIPQLRKTGDNFSLWERQLNVMLRNLTGTSDYFQQDLHKHDPKLNQAVFSLIFWSIDEELQQDFIIHGSAGDAFQFLANRFQSRSLAQCIINRTDFPEEILDNIVSMVHRQSTKEHTSIKERKMERQTRTRIQGLKFDIYVSHEGSPILNTFQNLAAVNRKFHRLCLTRLWQDITFPTSVPAPMSLWTDDLLLKHAALVKSVEFELEDQIDRQGSHQLSESERSLYDNTSLINDNEEDTRCGIGLLNIVKIFKVCSSIESVTVHLPMVGHDEWYSGLTVLLKSPFQLLPQLQHLRVLDDEHRVLSGDFIIDIIKILPSLTSLEINSFIFVQKQSEEESLGWNVAQLQKLRKLTLWYITCEDHTWSLRSWPERLTSLKLQCCGEITLGMVHELISGNTPFLTQLHLGLDEDDMAYFTVQFDLPALESLHVDSQSRIDLLSSFENCKSIEFLGYNGDIDDNIWDSMKNQLSRRTWPKLLVLDVRNLSVYLGEGKIGKEKMKEILMSFGIKVTIIQD